VLWLRGSATGDRVRYRHVKETSLDAFGTREPRKQAVERLSGKVGRFAIIQHIRVSDAGTDDHIAGLLISYWAVREERNRVVIKPGQFGYPESLRLQLIHVC
jgi:hypothetical protein